jgi:3'-phosphoadenosine 5'-phosphosulfate sulfotransferase (PAPS reductase)/FAD synthetase
VSRKITLNFGPYEHRLEASPEGIAKLDRKQRERRVELLIRDSHLILDKAIEELVTKDGKTVAGVVGLFSGGNDSTVLCHMMSDVLSHLGHANTTIGIEQTRQFVRDTAKLWDIPLLEFKPPREVDHYRSLVLDQGFPGPGHHFKMYQRLKERGLHQMRRTLVQDRSQRIVLVAGRRREESRRRANIPEMEREGSMVWASPLVHWTKLDMNTYRLMFDVPVNEVSDLLHMSGECLCGSFAHAGELDEIAMWFPDVANQIKSLEEELSDRSDIPDKRKKWGWGAREEKGDEKSGALCSSCDVRREASYAYLPLWNDDADE